MTSQFSTLKEFVYMHGFGVYVWSSYGFCILVLILFAGFSLYQYKKRLRVLKKMLLNQSKFKKAKEVVITYE